MRNVLIILTSNYPYRNIGSAYEEQEVLFLSKYFKKIYVICESKKIRKHGYKIPDNVIVYSKEPKRNLWYKILSICYVFNKTVLHELKIVKNTLNLKINKNILAILLVEFYNAKIINNYIKKIIKRENINNNSLIIHTFWNDYRAIALALIKLKNKKTTVISRAHRGDIYFEGNTGNYLPLKSFILDNIDGLFCISSHIKKYYEDKLKRSFSNIFISHLGTFRNCKVSEKIKSNDSSDIILYSCSNIIGRKRVDLIAKSISLINDYSVSWTHIGGDYTNFAVLNFTKEFLQNSKHKYNFLGALNNHELFVKYADNYVDIFINVSESEGVPVSVMEAMSFGIPVIATDVGGTSEIVKNGYNGFLLSANPSSNEVAETITKFYNLSCEEKLKMRNNSYKTWDEEYNAEKNYKAFAEKILSM